MTINPTHKRGRPAKGTRAARRVSIRWETSPMTREALRELAHRRGESMFSTLSSLVVAAYNTGNQ